MRLSYDEDGALKLTRRALEASVECFLLQWGLTFEYICLIKKKKIQSLGKISKKYLTFNVKILRIIRSMEYTNRIVYL